MTYAFVDEKNLYFDFIGSTTSKAFETSLIQKKLL